MAAQTAIKETPRGVSLALTVVPRSARDEVVGQEGDAIKIRLKAPPVDGKANAALVDLLADRLGVARSDIRMLSGASGRHKVVHIAGLSVIQAQERLLTPAARG